MPRPSLPDEDIEALEEILRSDPKLSGRSVREQYVLDHGEERAPAERTINKYLSPLRQKLKNRRDEDPVRPLDQWNGNPDEIRILFAVHRVATNVCAKYEIRDFEGLTERQYKWAKTLSPFFNLSDYVETAWLLDFALRFADDEKFFTDTDRKFVPRVSATNLLEKWQWQSSKWSQAKQRATVAPWEMGDDVEQRIAIALGYQPPIYRHSKEEVSEAAEEEELLDGAYRVISMATTDQMIMPVDIPGEEFREPPPEIAEAFAETFAQARLRVAKEEAERAVATDDDHSGDEQTVLTKAGVLKLVSELLEDPGALSKEKAAELAMNLVATYDEILNRHTEG